MPETLSKVVGVAEAAKWTVAGSTIFPFVGTVLGAIFGYFSGKNKAENIRFKGLGAYDETTFFDFKQSDWWGKAQYVQFSMKKMLLESWKNIFHMVRRIDSHYNNPYKTDTDRDGFQTASKPSSKAIRRMLTVRRLPLPNLRWLRMRAWVWLLSKLKRQTAA